MGFKTIPGFIHYGGQRMNAKESEKITTKQFEKITLLTKGINMSPEGLETLVELKTQNRTSHLECMTYEEASLFINELTLFINSKPITPAQIKKIHALLNQKGIMEHKRAIIHSFSDGRTTSTKELTCNDAKLLIDHLQQHDEKAREEIRKRARVEFRAIYGLAWKMDIIYGTTDDDYHINVAKLNMFCRERGTVKKNLTDMTLAELCKTHRQFEAMYNKFKNKKIKK
jgi:hypothetical protein